MRLLWVENHDLFVRMAGRQFLTDHDLQVVPSIAEALASIAAESFDALLVDYDLDDGKGAELIEHIRDHFSSLPVIAVSAHAEGNAALLTAGADAACPKCQFSEIETFLEQALRARGEGYH